ncbi:MAG: 1-(5-phosphoribosyl)-5-[(5-phosphoribosylamino)methylideneamino]imidazole-4-carboxamide isomerase [Bacteroidales bacterium]|nr:1-(5-phosphoribosyl)-5-[(5-phosphoribosylamino)methylideneamino]imidazole-4-carboxamide isomerase [Bacteroidales bacterium]
MMEIIPAIDIIEGRCVRLTRGDYGRKKEYGDPFEMALLFEDHGIRRLHLVDLDGARENRVVNYRILERIASRTSLVIDAGGGIRSDKDLKIVFDSGAHMITGGSVAVRERDLFLGWLERYGADRIILGADFREGKLAVSGWNEDTSLELGAFIAAYRSEGIKKVICTDIERDGMLEGPSLEIYKELKASDGELHLVASGGISGMDDLELLEKEGIDGAIVGKAIYEGKIPLKTLETYILNQR